VCCQTRGTGVVEAQKSSREGPEFIVLSAKTPTAKAATIKVATAARKRARFGPALDVAPTLPIRGRGDGLLVRLMRSATVPAHVLAVRSQTKERLPNHHVQHEPTRLGVQVPKSLRLPG